MGEWAAAEKKARSQWGAITFDQLRELGLGGNAIRWATESKRLVRLFRGAFRFSAVAACWQQRAFLATQIGGEGSALSHATAASVWRLNGFATRGSPVHVSVPTRRMLRLPGEDFAVHRPRCLFDALSVDGFQVTRLARTIIDVAESVADQQLEILLDAAQHRFSLLPEWLAAELPLHRQQATPGLARLRKLLGLRQGVTTESPLETQFRGRLRAHGLPPPRLQFEISDATGLIMRADAAWPDHLVVMHVDSFRWHATRVQFVRDAQQRRRLAECGWLSIVVTDADLGHSQWLDQLARTLERRNPQRDLFLPPPRF